MNRHTKVFITFALLLLIVIVLKFTKEYKDTNELKKQIVKEESKSLAALVVAFRQTYQERFIKNHILIDEKNVELLPVRTMSDISNKFSSLIDNRAIIRTVSDRPRNPKNQANEEEMKMINYFNSNKDKDSYFEATENAVFYFAQPLYIKQGCLKCHGKKEDALDLIKKNYTTAYNYKLGDLRGVLSIKIDKTDIINKLDESYYSGVKAAIFIYLLFLAAIFMMIKIILKNEEQYALTLEKKVQKQVNELREKEKLMSEQSKLAAMGEMIGNIAHQWRQPLSIISTGASGVKLQKEMDLLTDKDLNETMSLIVEQSEYLSETIDDFRNFIKGEKRSSTFDLKSTINSFLHLVEGTIKDHDMKIQLDLQEDITLNSYPNELTQCLINFLNNSKDILEEKEIDPKYIVIKTYQINENAVIEFLDNGGGIPEDIIDKIFEPYFTTKHQSHGTGLGLNMTYNFIHQKLNGTVTIENKSFTIDSTNYTGAKFKIIIPLNNI